MTEDRARAFEGRPGAAAAVRLRRWDERAKVPQAPTRPLDAFVPLLRGTARA